jgi:hypothetical protein
MNVLNNKHKLQRLKARYTYTFINADFANKFIEMFRYGSRDLQMRRRVQINTRSFYLLLLFKV